ncbi:MAG: UTP--glucose-1-phosphate uridylyltransferase [Erysipelotrichaceae bacterium]|jgi:UTP--glucose-1-phosphate uridylyltransferase|nr:UTP--glucose-1-phosphate uridylyltransferase [Erysipelotrichaceae bacterium]
MGIKKVKKAVIPAAGLGTRFLPATKAMAKEMLPIVDIPTLQYQVKEAVDSGIEEVILIISEAKKEIIKHFSAEPEYVAKLRAEGKENLAKIVEDIPKMAKITYVYQLEQKGLGHAILCAKEAVGDEPFVVILGDDLVINEDGEPVSKQMIDLYNETGHSVIGCQAVADSELEKYGIVKIKGDKLVNRVGELVAVVEKPKTLAEAPSNIACLGRYLFTPEIFSEIEKVEPVKNEIYLTAAIESLAQKEPVLVYDFIGRRYDVGDKYGFVEAVIDFALKRDDLRDKVMEHITTIIENNKTRK